MTRSSRLDSITSVLEAIRKSMAKSNSSREILASEHIVMALQLIQEEKNEREQEQLRSES